MGAVSFESGAVLQLEIRRRNGIQHVRFLKNFHALRQQAFTDREARKLLTLQNDNVITLCCEKRRRHSTGGPGADNHGGMAVLIGLPGWDITIDSRLFVTHQRQYRGSLGATYPDKDFAMFLRWYQEGKFPLDKLVTRRYTLDDINEACDALKSGEIAGRAIIEY